MAAVRGIREFFVVRDWKYVYYVVIIDDAQFTVGPEYEYLGFYVWCLPVFHHFSGC